MTPNFVEIVPPFNGQQKCTPSAAIQLPDFGASKVPTNVCFWLLADIATLSELGPLTPESGHSGTGRKTSVNDPKQTLIGLRTIARFT